MAEHDEHLSATLASNNTGPMLGRAAWVRILPFLAYILFIALADVLARAGVPAPSLRWLYAVKIGVVVVLLAACWREYDELRGARLAWRPLLVAVLSGAAVLVLWVSLDADWMSVGSAAGFDPRTGGRIDWLMVAVRIFGAAAVVPIMEELFWRSFLMRWIAAADFHSLDPSQATLKSMLVTSVLFGFEHNLWLAGIVAGAAYTALYVRYRTLWMSILAHAVTNLLLGIWVVRTASWAYW